MSPDVLVERLLALVLVTPIQDPDSIWRAARLCVPCHRDHC